MSEVALAVAPAFVPTGAVALGLEADDELELGYVLAELLLGDVEPVDDEPIDEELIEPELGGEVVDVSSSVEEPVEPPVDDPLVDAPP